MADFGKKIKQALDESRILVLGAQAFIGFGFRGVFERGFENLPPATQYAKLGGLAAMMLALGFLVAPSAYHRIVERGEDTHALHRFTSGLMLVALAPFVIGLGIDLFVATERVVGRGAALATGAAAVIVAVFFWYGLEAIARRRRGRGTEDRTMKQQEPRGGTPLEQKIEQVLTEARVVLPGAQALLGFQLAAMLTESFERLPALAKHVHLGSLALVALATIFLMTPAAYHRIVERGEDTEHFHRFASGCLLAAMIPLPLGLAGDFFIVTAKVTGSTMLAVGGAIVALAFFYSIWFGLTFALRARNGARAATTTRPRAEAA